MRYFRYQLIWLTSNVTTLVLCKCNVLIAVLRISGVLSKFKRLHIRKFNFRGVLSLLHLCPTELCKARLSIPKTNTPSFPASFCFLCTKYLPGYAFPYPICSQPKSFQTSNYGDVFSAIYPEHQSYSRPAGTLDCHQIWQTFCSWMGVLGSRTWNFWW